MIIQTLIQLKGESEPRQHFALVFDDVARAEDFIPYRNALTTVAKAVITSSEPDAYADELFWIVQMAEFISSSLDLEYQKKGGAA